MALERHNGGHWIDSVQFAGLQCNFVDCSVYPEWDFKAPALIGPAGTTVCAPITTQKEGLSIRKVFSHLQ
jgi:hypothetical protein